MYCISESRANKQILFKKINAAENVPLTQNSVSKLSCFSKSFLCLQFL